MKLLRYGSAGIEHPAILDSEGALRDLSSVVTDITGASLRPESLKKLRQLNPRDLPLVAGTPRLGPCVGSVGKFICIGLNYSDHAAESGMKVPTEPVVFMKATSAICGPNDTVVIPRGAEKADWEVELGVVIGKEAKYVEEHEALTHVAGYCVVNDLSERAFQLEGTGQWVKGKSADTFGPIGPLAGYHRRSPRSAESAPLAGSGRTPLSGRFHKNYGLRGRSSDQLSKPFHEPPAGRHHLNGYPSRGGLRPEAASLSTPRASYDAGHRWIGATTPSRRCVREAVTHHKLRRPA